MRTKLTGGDSRNNRPSASSRGKLWFQMAETRQKISLLDVLSRIFLGKCPLIYIISISGGDYMRLIFKICQTVAGVSMTSQFHEFFQSDFWRVSVNLAQLSNFEPESCKGDEEKSSFSFGKFIEDHFHNHLHFPKIEPL